MERYPVRATLTSSGGHGADDNTDSDVFTHKTTAKQAISMMDDNTVKFEDWKPLSEDIPKNMTYQKYADIEDWVEMREAVVSGNNLGSWDEVETVSIDEFVEENSIERVNFIKADVEGSELALLSGAKETILKFKPAISITTYHFADDANRIVEAILEIEKNGI